MRYPTPSDEVWTPADSDTLRKLATATVEAGHHQCGEPPNSGITFTDACQVLQSLAKSDEKVAHLIPDNLG